MTGILPPIAGTPRISQYFDGADSAERRGWLASFAGRPWRARNSIFLPAVFRLHLHGAIDYVCPVGTPIRAVEDGIIVDEGTYSSTGEHYCQVRFHRDTGWQTVSFDTHIKAGGLLHPVGTAVKRGQTIALSGNSGMSTGPHLHHEIRRGPVTADPRLSAAWDKYNPLRLQVGGDLADVPWITPAQ